MLRAKITPVLDTETGAVVVTIDWIDAEAPAGSEAVKQEQFRISPNRAGCSFVSSVGVVECREEAPHFVDAHGKRHFVVKAEMALMGCLAGV